jgi:hypothetical protein
MYQLNRCRMHPVSTHCVFLCVYVVLEIEPKALIMLGQYSTTEPYPKFPLLLCKLVD